MIFTDRTITINRDIGTIDEPIILYRGDKNVLVQFALKNCPFRCNASTIATYGQLIIERAAGYVFSAVEKVTNSKVIFVITEDMIDELIELGEYKFQIRIFNEEQTSRVTLPVVNTGIIIKEPICCEEGDGGGSVDGPASEPEEYLDPFDSEDNYNKTIWKTGDKISASNLNKIEDAIYEINENANKDDETLNQLRQEIDAVSENIDNDIEAAKQNAIQMARHYVDELQEEVNNQMLEHTHDNYATNSDVSDLSFRVTSNYVTKTALENAIKNVSVDLTGYATESYVNDAISNIQSGDGFTHAMVTQAEYDALSDEEKNAEDTLYIITESDAVDSYYTKSDIDKMLGDINTILDAINGDGEVI